MKHNKLNNKSFRLSTSDDIELATYLEIAKSDSLLGKKPEVDSKNQTIIIFDFGSQYSRLIARRVRELNTYCELVDFDSDSSILKEKNVIGFIFSGGPNSVYDKNAPLAPTWVYESNKPILGICYGMQIISHQLGGKVISEQKREYGHTIIHKNRPSKILSGIDDDFSVWMSHGDRIESKPLGFVSIAFSDNSPEAIIADEKKQYYGLQFHPEVLHTPSGSKILKNFLFDICNSKGSWTSKKFVSQAIQNIKMRVGKNKVICALSGGVDSTVTAALIHKAIGDNLTCIFVDNGLMRKGEVERIRQIFTKDIGANLIFYDGKKRFLESLRNVIDPEEKRKIIGAEFINIFEEVAKDIGKVGYLAQGTLYPDVIESTSRETGSAHKIKTHHNVGGLPEKMKLKLIEPLRYLFKDEVRLVGVELGLSNKNVYRQPFPGPGLAIRIIGEITDKKLEILREADWIIVNEIKSAGLYEKIWQSFAVLTNTQTVGVMGDKRTYQYVIAIRSVDSNDAMTADWSKLSYDLLGRISNRIVNEVNNVNRVVFDITSKPPGTIEWE
ncbi:MAG: glutamine-hydrolyzing GMP synthase [Chloroflexi bacterium]|nr:glutamine-hydrolyzing GMP synthase [Chloroflexota bacterium]